MKKTYLLLLAVFLLVSCGDDNKKSVEDIISEGNLENIRAKKSEILLKQKEISDQAKLLDEAISKLDTSKNLPLITTFQAKSNVFQHYLDIQGSVQTKQNILLYPEFSGILNRIYVKEGQRVSKGQLLASIDDGGLGQQLSQLEVQEALAKTTYERQERLWNQKIGSEMQFLQAKANYEAQQKAVSQMRSQLGKTSIRAPFSGTIDDIITDQGTVVGAGQSEVIRLVNLKNMFIEAEVPESYIKYITKGKEVTVFFPVLNETIVTSIHQVGNYINPNNRSFKIEVSVPNSNELIKPNLTAKLKINDYTNEKAILIPQSIISENSEGEQYVYITNSTDNPSEAIAKRTLIETGETQGDFVEILKGVNDGDTIVNEGARSVKDGQTVKILTVETNE